VSTSAQRREIIRAVNGERARCAKLMENARTLLGNDGAWSDGKPGRAWEVLTDYLDRIKRPYRVRRDARRRVVPGRLRKCCGVCGGDDHTAPKCPRADILGGVGVSDSKPLRPEEAAYLKALAIRLHDCGFTGVQAGVGMDSPGEPYVYVSGVLDGNPVEASSGLNLGRGFALQSLSAMVDQVAERLEQQRAAAEVHRG
jgi:hypothetical protein